MNANTATTAVTRDVAALALRVHRLALAAEDVRYLQSPATRPHPDDGIPRPTEDAALCVRRSHVRDTLTEIADDLGSITARLTHALDVWEGRV